MVFRQLLKPQLAISISKYSSVSESFLKTELCKGIKNITLCHQKTRNSLSITMMNELINAIEKDKNNSNLRVIVLSAEGKVFSAGHNLNELSSKHGVDQQKLVFSLASKLMDSIINSPVPIIAKVDGLAAAAGCQLVAQCDLVLCTTESTFSTPGANFGIFCSTPGIALSRAVSKSTALKMLLTGIAISSSEAKEAGLVTEICASADIENCVQTYCDAIKSKSRAVIELGKKFYYKQINTDLKNAYYLGQQTMVDNLQLVDGQEGIDSFIQKRKPTWKHF